VDLERHRPLERVVSLILLILLTPVYVGTGIGDRRVCSGPVRQWSRHWRRRSQVSARLFWTLKFRSHVVGPPLPSSPHSIEYVVDDSGPECKNRQIPESPAASGALAGASRSMKLPQFIKRLARQRCR